MNESTKNAQILPPPLPALKPRKRKSNAWWIILIVVVAAVFYVGIQVLVVFLFSKVVGPGGLNAGLPFNQSGAGSTMYSPYDGMLMVYVPDGYYYMGSPDGIGGEDEHPMTEVYQGGYWIDQTEITNGMYRKCVEAKVCTPPVKQWSKTRSYYYSSPEYAEYPVVYVTMFQAQEYCKWVRRTLPSEVHWEVAARGYDDYTYPWGYDEPDCAYANFEGCAGDTEQVRSHPDNQGYYGTYDMGGNVQEWTISGYWTYPTSSDLFFANIPEDEYRVLRGGGFRDEGYWLRSMARSTALPGESSDAWGFRCIQPVDYEHLLAEVW